MGRSRRPPREWAAIEMAAFLNRALGTSFITPWNLGEIPEHWIELIVQGRSLESRLIEQGLVK